ncbi:MAG: chorismate synthase [Bacteroidetes bacterium]|nr:MAG: chorismate synthase [Bacteroidota bacterium]
MQQLKGKNNRVMNHFGQYFRVSIFGESHGAGPGIVIDGCPAGLPLCEDDFLPDLERRKGGQQKGTTPRKEDDYPLFKSGIFNGLTTGAPLAIFFENNNTRSGDYEKQRAVPRPGHADFVANKKFGGFEDYRGGGHFSGRLTVCLVAAGVVAKRILAAASGNAIAVSSNIAEIGGEADLERGLQRAIDEKDSVGGIVACTVEHLPIGLGEPFWNSIESLISHAVFAIPAVRGIEFGTGFAAARMFGVQHNDAIANADGQTTTNHAGGVVGGITNGNPLSFRIAIKPTSSTPKTQHTLNWETGEIEDFSVKGRHDLCIALRVPPVLEAVTAMVLADAMLAAQLVPRVIDLSRQWVPSPMVYHITTQAEWHHALATGSYLAPSVAHEGFMHASLHYQTLGVLQRYYGGQTDLVKLCIDTSQLQCELRYEWADSMQQYFPHVYGAIPCAAVVRVEPVA